MNLIFIEENMIPVKYIYLSIYMYSIVLHPSNRILYELFSFLSVACLGVTQVTQRCLFITFLYSFIL